MPPKQRTASDAAIQAAADAGIDICFANPGTTECWLVAALDGCSRIRNILGLHETVCAGAADGYARMARRPALALLHLGPGLANGICNLHNARRAMSPVVVLLGDMATWHSGADAPLSMDIDAVASCIAACTLHVRSPAGIEDGAAAVLRQAVHASIQPSTQEDYHKGRTSVVVLPHDISWTPVDEGPAAAPASASGAAGAGAPHSQSSSCGSSSEGPKNGASKPISNGSSSARALQDNSAAQEFVRDCAAALNACHRGKAALLIGGAAALQDDGALLHAGQIASHTGAALLSEAMPARIDRGAGRPRATRLPYFPKEAADALAAFELLVLVDARRPVAMFGYNDGLNLSQLVQLPDERVWEVDASWGASGEVLAMLAQELGAGGVRPGVNCGGVFATPSRQPLPTGKLSASAVCGVVAALQPEGTILVDESVSSGLAYWEMSQGSPPFSHLTLTGGAIGMGPPAALGAALACPGRKVINLQADGSAMYSLQALWSQAREGADVLTIICANSTYAILKIENMRQRVPSSSGKKATRALLDLSQPEIDWVALASGMGVSASRATTAEDLAAQMKEALARKGPHLIQAVMPA